MNEISWPDRYRPNRVAAHVRNEITIAAPPSSVWAWLVRAPLWPNWYPNSRNVRIAGGAELLSAGSHFTWRTFGVKVSSTVREFEPETRIAWDGSAPMLDIYHAWLVEARPGGNTWVLTEENQNGLAARIQAWLMPKRMYRGHELWLARLRDKAEAGPPPGT